MVTYDRPGQAFACLKKKLKQVKHEKEETPKTLIAFKGQVELCHDGIFSAHYIGCSACGVYDVNKHQVHSSIARNIYLGLHLDLICLVFFWGWGVGGRGWGAVWYSFVLRKRRGKKKRRAKLVVLGIMACLCFDVQSVSMDAPVVGFFLAPWQS